jgi:hypothetical protein
MKSDKQKKLTQAAFEAAGLAGRADLMAEEGGCISTQEAEQRFGDDVSLIEQRVTANLLIGIKDPDARIALLVWQFDQHGHVLDGIPTTLKVLAQRPGFNPTTALRFFLSSHPRLKGRRPLDAVRNGNIAEAIAAAESELD